MKDLQRRTLSPFDLHSLMLFAALTLGSTAGVHAQVAPPGTPGFGPGDRTTPSPRAESPAQGNSRSGSPGFGIGPGAPSTGPTQARTAVDAAFERADTNRDGALTRDEAQRLPAIAERFDAIDTDRSGTLSRDEVARGTRS
ncbi:MAG: EF-hand domain-containing protein [Burkholderiaceae bacterium]